MCLASRSATTNATSPMTDSTDRSTFRVRTTIASPTAAIAMIAANTVTWVRFETDRNCGAWSATNAPSSSMTATRLSSRWRAMTASDPEAGRAERPPARADVSHGDRSRRPRRGRRIPVAPPSAWPVAANMTRSSEASDSVDLGGDDALVHDQDPVGHREHLGQVARDQQDPQAGRGELGDDPVDLDLGPDVDPAGRLVEDEDPRLGREPLGEDDLLLVPAGQAPTGWSTPVARIWSWSA